MWRGDNTGNLQLDFKNLWKHSDLNWNQLLLKIICVQMCYVAVSKYHTCFIMQKLIPQLSKTWNKQIYALQDLPASLDIGICRPFGTACSSPPSPERAFSRKFERHHEILNSPFHVILERASWLGYFSESLWNPEKCFCFFKISFHSWPFPKLPVVVFSNICGHQFSDLCDCCVSLQLISRSHSCSR